MPSFDSVSSVGPNAGVSTLSQAHTLGAGANLLAILGIGAAGGTLRTVNSSPSYGAQSFTQIPSARVTSGSDFVDLWYLIAPSGNQTWSFNLSGTQSQVAAGLIVLADCDQTSPLHTAATNTGTGAALSVSIASAVGELIVAFGLDDFNASGWSWAVTTGTSRFVVGSGSGNIGLAGATQTGASPTGTVTFTEAGGANNSTKLASGISILPFTGGGGSTVTYPELERMLRGANRGMLLGSH